MFAGCTNPEIGRAQVLELAGAGLGDFDAGNEREDDVRGETLLEIGLDANCICGVDENASVLRCNDRLDNSGKVVHVRQSLDAQEDIVVRIFSGRGLFRDADHCKTKPVRTSISNPRYYRGDAYHDEV